jgi:hypothetical protein
MSTLCELAFHREAAAGGGDESNAGAEGDARESDGAPVAACPAVLAEQGVGWGRVSCRRGNNSGASRPTTQVQVHLSGGRRAASQRRCLSPQRGTSAQHHKRHIVRRSARARREGSDEPIRRPQLWHRPRFRSTVSRTYLCHANHLEQFRTWDK